MTANVLGMKRFNLRIKRINMNTKKYLKAELDKIDKNIYLEIDGYGNVDYVVEVMELYAQVVNKNDLLPDVSQRSELLLAFVKFCKNENGLHIPLSYINEFLKANNCG